MTATVEQPSEISPQIRDLLSALRRRIRRYVWLHGTAAMVAWLAAAFWVSLGVDWFFEPPPAARVVMLAVVLAGTLAVLWFAIFRRLLVPLGDSSMAMLLERRYPEFHESLLTAVELADRPHEEDYAREMFRRTSRRAEEPLRNVRLASIFNPAPLRRMTAIALVLVAAVAVLAVESPQALGVWSRRTLLLAPELWPRKTRLMVEGFENGTVKVARGADLAIIAKADTRMPLVPDVVEVHSRTEGGPNTENTMSREGTADPRRDRFQEYSHTFAGILAPIEFDVLGGDAAVRNLRIQVVDSPTIVAMALECRFPAYMDRPPSEIPVAGIMQVPLGTHVTVHARANKPLVQAQIQSALDESPGSARLVKPLAGDPRRLEYMIGILDRDQTLLLTLDDADGIRSREPVRLTIMPAPDQPPELAVQLQGIGTAITPRARLPLAGQIRDDYGLAAVWFEHAIDEQTAQKRDVATISGNVTEWQLDQALEVEGLSLTPGQKFTVSAKAVDRCDLAGGANVGTSDRWLLDVVTAEQLRTMLESRELVLRQRFESIINEVVETRESLARMEFQTAASDESAEAPGAEPGDAAPEAVSPQRLLNLRTLRVQRAQQNSQKDAQEVLGTAQAFGDIRAELVNNRIDTEELKIRLEDGIAAPLRRVAEELFPELDRRLARLETRLADTAQGPEDQRAAVQQADAILLQMRQVLAKMIELEDFNQAIELLREIIAAQEQIGERTGQLQKEQLRDLLE